MEASKEINRNLNLTPQQRIEEHQKALNLLHVLEKVKKVNADARPESTT